jgi:hypothetical protein
VTAPKAYLRLDPDIDQKHPDLLAELIRAMCAANRQRPRGRFDSRAVVEALYGKATVRKLYERGDLVDQPDGSVYLDQWDEWQEGDVTVIDRMRRLRQRNRGVTEGVTRGVSERSDAA